MYELVLIRHGQSEWNKQNLFTGWVDVPLSEQGISEAVEAGQILKKNNYKFTFAYTSQLMRAIKTLWLTLEELGQMNIPVVKNWQLNERHYGGLQGKNKKETAEEFGEEQVKIWRRSFSTPPPVSDQEEVPAEYKGLEVVPRGESLELTCKRVIPYWDNEIKNRVKAGEKIIIAAHGNSLRALIKHLEGISDDEILKLEIPTGKPISMKLDENFNFISREYIQ